MNMHRVIKGSEIWVAESLSGPESIWTVILLEGSAQATGLNGSTELPPCSISFWQPENLEQVRFTQSLGIVTTHNPARAPFPATAEPMILDGLSCEILLSAFIENQRPPAHQSAALDLVCHQLANRTAAADKIPGSHNASIGGEEKRDTTEGKILSEQVSDYMGRHLDETLTLGDLAEVFGCTPARISAAFRREQNTSPMKVLAAHRLKMARKLLQNSDMPITQIGTAVGYSDQASFTHFFKRHTAMSPREFRENHRWLL